MNQDPTDTIDIFFEACKIGDVPLLNAMIENGFDIQVYDNHSAWLACINGQTSALHTLIAHGADITVDHNLFFNIACKYGYADIVILLLENDAIIEPDDERPLFHAIRGGHADIVAILMNAVPFVAVQNGTALECAIQANQTNIATHLVIAGSPISQNAIQSAEKIAAETYADYLIAVKLWRITKKIALWKLQNCMALHEYIWAPPSPWRPEGSIMYRKSFRHFTELVAV